MGCTGAELAREGRHPRQRIAHAGHALVGRHDVGGSRRGRHARAFRMHAAHGGDSAPSGLPRQRPARVAVAAGAETRAADEDVRSLLLEPGQQLRQRLRLVFAEVVVAADERDGDLQSQSATRTHGARQAFRGQAGRSLRAAPREELVQVVRDLHQVTARSLMSPIWETAPRYSTTRRGPASIAERPL